MKEHAPVALVVVVYLALSLARIDRWPGPDLDEGVFANPALNLLQHGNFGSSTMKGVYGLDRVTFWFLPLHSLLLTVPNGLFGFGYIPGRVWNTALLLFGLMLLYRLALDLGLSRRSALLLVAFLGTDYHLIRITHSGRMEVLIFTLHSGILYCLTRAVRDGRRRLILAAGVLAGMASLAHPLGTMCVLPFLVLAFPRSSHPEAAHPRRTFFQSAATYVCGVALPLLPYGVFVLSEGTDEFYRQFFTLNEYGYRMMGLVFSPAAHIPALWKEATGSITWLFLGAKILALACFCRLKGPATRLVLLAFAYAFVLTIIWSGIEFQYWLPALYPTLALCAVSGTEQSALAAIGTRARRVLPVGLATAWFGLVGLNIYGVCLRLYEYRNDDPQRSLAELRSLVISAAPPGRTIVGDAAYIFALPDYDLRSFMVVRTNMDLQSRTSLQVLSDISPDVIIVDDTLASGLWPAFSIPPSGVREFLMRNGRFIGAVPGGPHWPRGPIEVYQVDAKIFRENPPTAGP